MPFLLPAFWILGLKGNVRLNVRSRTILVPVVCQRPVVAVALATEVSGTSGAPQGIVGTEMSGASISGSVAPYLPGSFDSAFPLVNWRRVESEAELAYSQVASVEWLLHQTLASVHCNILCPVQVSLRKENEKNPSISPTTSSVLTCFFTSCSHSSYLRAS
jgi:hypothetical protein